MAIFTGNQIALISSRYCFHIFQLKNFSVLSIFLDIFIVASDISYDELASTSNKYGNCSGSRDPIFWNNFKV